MQSADLHARFLLPSAAYRGKPFWSWNGRLERAELIRQVHVLHRMGMGGFFIHSRTGLATEYLGDEWFDLVNACAEEADRLGMETWLYDEDRWPSGTAGGMVTADPAYRMRFVRMTEMTAGEFAWTEDALAAFVCRKAGLAIRRVRRLSPGEAPQDPSATALVFRVVEMAPSSFYNGFTYVDTMNPAATRQFIQMTHERYRLRCGDRLGASIRGIFTDEPHRGALMDPFGGEAEQSERQVPWTAALPERFLAAFGYDLVDRLPELFLQLDGEPISQVKWHFVEMLMRLFLEGFAQPYDQWCREHGLAVTGHVLHEDSLTAQTAMCGSVMRYYEHMSLPGIDLLTENNRAFWVAKQLQSAGRQLGRRFLLSELYGCTGWQMPFKGHKAVGDWQALFGINVRSQHLSWYTMDGEAKRDFPASIFHQSAWWRAYRHVEDYFSRIGVLMDQGERVCETLVLSPVESVWARVHPGWSHYLGATQPAVRELERKYAQMFHWLQGAHIDFDYGDEEMLGRLSTVEADGTLRLGAAQYKAVIVGGMETIRATTLAVLRRLIESGGNVIFAGTPPTHVDARPSAVAAVLAQDARTAGWSKYEVVRECESAVDRVVSVHDATTSVHIPTVFAQARRDADGRMYLMLLNTDRETAAPNAIVQMFAAGPVVEWDCLTGDRLPVRAQQVGGLLLWHVNLEPAGSRLYVIGEGPDNKPDAARQPAAAAWLPIAGPFPFELSEPNVLVLDKCEWQMSDSPWSEPAEVLKADRSVRKALGLAPRGGEMLQPWFTAKQGYRPLAEVRTRFVFEIEHMPAQTVDLVIERSDALRVTINGRELRPPAEAQHWLDVCFTRVPIPGDALRPGANEVVLTGDYHEGIGLESIYLLGRFGVRVAGDKTAMTALPDRLDIGDLCEQGLPFFGGALSLRIALPPEVAAADGARTMLRSPGLSAACAVAAKPGAALPDTGSLDLGSGPADSEARHLLAWDPYEVDVTDLIDSEGQMDLQVYLTRRNTFGPLHQLPRQVPGYGPGNWLTEGPGFSDSYVLWPSGLIEAPEVSVRP